MYSVLFAVYSYFVLCTLYCVLKNIFFSLSSVFTVLCNVKYVCVALYTIELRVPIQLPSVSCRAVTYIYIVIYYGTMLKVTHSVVVLIAYFSYLKYDIVWSLW